MRRRLLLALGIIPLVMLLAGATLVVQLDRQRTMFHHVNSELIKTVRLSESFAASVNLIGQELWRARSDEGNSLDRLASAVEDTEKILTRLAQCRELQMQHDRVALLKSRLDQFKLITARLATSHAQKIQAPLSKEMAATAGQMQEDTAYLRDFVSDHADKELQDFQHTMNVTIVVLLFVVIVPMLVSIYVIQRVLDGVAEPVQELVNATEYLSDGHFEYRVPTSLRDEFGQLARSFNAMAERLGTAEERRVQAVRETAVTLQHYINNSLAALMGLAQILSRSKLPPSQQHIPADIEEQVNNIYKVMQKLNQLQQVITIDYTSGISMIDPEEGATPETDDGRSGQEDSGESSP